MNEAEKKIPAQELSNPNATPAEEVRPEEQAAACECENEVCAETESPALALAEAADSAREDVGIHSKNKEELVDMMKDIIARNDLSANRIVASIKSAYFALRSKEINEEMMSYVDAGNDPTAFSATPDPLETELKELQATFRERRNEYLEEDKKRREANLARKNEILDGLRALASDIDNANLNFNDFKQLQQDFKEKADLPEGADNEVWKNYGAVVEQFYDCLKMNKELRDLDFKKNLEAKTVLLEKAKELGDLEDVVEAKNRLQALHAEWREIGPVAKELREEIWEQFKNYSSVVNKRHAEFYEARHAAEKQNEEVKNGLIAELEAINPEEIKSFDGWDEATKQVLEIQKRWKLVGFASRKVNNTLFARYRELCDIFFSKKSEYYTNSKAENSENLAKKLELCEKAEKLAEMEDLAKAAEMAVALQGEWKTIGSVGKRRSEEVWKRFSTACNSIFTRRKEMYASRRKEENENLKAKREIIEQLKTVPLDGDVKENLKTVRELQARWNEIGFVPVKVKDSLRQEYRELCDKIYDAYNEARQQDRRSGYRGRLEKGLKRNERGGSERDRLNRILEAKRNDLKTIENNLGFFKNVKTAAGNSMLRDIERRKQQLADEIAVVLEKIDELDRQGEEKE